MLDLLTDHTEVYRQFVRTSPSAASSPMWCST